MCHCHAGKWNSLFGHKISCVVYALSLDMGFDMGTLVWITAGAKYRLSERVKNGVRDNQERA